MKRLSILIALLLCFVCACSAAEGDMNSEESYNEDVTDTVYEAETEDGEYVIGKESQDVSFSGDVDASSVSVADGDIGTLYIPNVGVLKGFSWEGDLYLDSGNEDDFSDPNTVLHSNSDYLSGILSYADENIFSENPCLYVVLNDTALEYRVFASYYANTEDILKEHNGYDYNAWCEYIDEIYAMNGLNVITDEGLYNDVCDIAHILTLQVDTGNEIDYILQAVLSGREEITVDN